MSTKAIFDAQFAPIIKAIGYKEGNKDSICSFLYELVATEQLCNGMWVVHGGALCSIIDFTINISLKALK